MAINAGRRGHFARSKSSSSNVVAETLDRGLDVSIAEANGRSGARLEARKSFLVTVGLAVQKGRVGEVGLSAVGKFPLCVACGLSPAGGVCEPLQTRS